MTKYKCIIFDLDDTLFDYQKTEIDSLFKACNTLSIQFDEETVYQLYKDANAKAKSKTFKLLTEDDYSKFRKLRALEFLKNIKCSFSDIESFVTLQLKYSEYGILIPEVYETLQEIYKETRIIIATNGSTYPRLNKLQNSKIAPFVYKFYSSEYLGFQKPDPIFFEKILSDNEPLVTKEVLVVGNEVKTDIIGALNYNLDCIHFNFNGTVHAQQNNQYAVIEKFSQVLNYMK